MVTVGVGVRVTVRVRVGVAVRVRMGVAVRVTLAGVGVALRVAVGVAVRVGVGVAAPTWTGTVRPTSVMIAASAPPTRRQLREAGFRAYVEGACTATERLVKSHVEEQSTCQLES